MITTIDIERMAEEVLNGYCCLSDVKTTCVGICKAYINDVEQFVLRHEIRVYDGSIDGTLKVYVDVSIDELNTLHGYTISFIEAIRQQAYLNSIGCGEATQC